MQKFTYRLLRRAELPIKTEELARWLLGKTLIHDTPQGRLSGRIVETEAYLVGDAAAHSFRGETPRNRSLFLERGHAYVYFIYGNWFSINVSGETAGVGAGVLIRALEPLEGIDLMLKKRPEVKATDITRGPGRLASAMGIDRRLDGLDLCKRGPLWLADAVRHRRGPVVVGTSTRIGLAKEAHRLLRFFEKGNPWVSGPKKLNGGEAD
jgi:DNA-3-methyladenine glycosylase